MWNDFSEMGKNPSHNERRPMETMRYGTESALSRAIPSQTVDPVSVHNQVGPDYTGVKYHFLFSGKDPVDDLLEKPGPGERVTRTQGSLTLTLIEKVG